MIGIIFTFGAEVVEVRIDENILLFKISTYGARYYPIENLHINKSGAIKMFPDLEDNEDWKNEALKRFKEYFIKIEGEQNKANYVIEELKKCGYIPKYKQIQGFRTQVIN